MVAAIQSVMSGPLSIRKAAVEINVPRSSLGDCIHGRVLHGKRNNPIRFSHLLMRPSLQLI